jgi:hypothetical protein
LRSWIVFAIGMFALISCASTPIDRAPDWVLTVPRPDGTDSYFTGSASGTDLTRATDDATANLVASITRYIGVKVTVDSSATARSTLAGYEATIRQTVTSQASNRLAGLRIKDKVVRSDKATGKVTVYLLAAYTTVDLEKERVRIAAAFQEKIDAVAKPESEGRSLLSAGRNREALGRFVDAAVAASGSDVENAGVKIERNLANALDALRQLRLTVASPAGSVYVGTSYPGPFTIRLLSSSDGQGIPGIALLVSYPRKQGTRIGTRTISAFTDETGILSYTPPAPDFAGKARLSVRVDFASELTLLDSIPAAYSIKADALREALSSIAADIDFTVISRAREVPTAVALVDLDDNGVSIPDAISAAALSEILVSNGFILVPIHLDSNLVVSGNADAIRTSISSLSGGLVARLVFGSTRIVSVRKDGAMYIAEARVSAKAIDVSTGRLLYSSERQIAAPGTDEVAARRAALVEAGSSALGADLLASLP